MDEAESDDETVPDLFFETIESSSGWTDITAHPPVSIDNIHKYFVTTRLRRDDVTACKPFEKGYRIFHAGYVQTVAIHAVSNESTYCIVRAMVLPSQRQNPQYKTAVGIIKTTGEVKHGYCTCIAGKSSSCNHVAALLFYIDDANRKQTTTCTTATCTSLPCTWKVPKAAHSLDITKPSINHSASKKKRHEPLDRVAGYVSIKRVMKLRDDLTENVGETLGFHQIWPATSDIRQEAQ